MVVKFLFFVPSNKFIGIFVAKLTFILFLENIFLYLHTYLKHSIKKKLKVKMVKGVTHTSSITYLVIFLILTGMIHFDIWILLTCHYYVFNFN